MRGEIKSFTHSPETSHYIGTEGVYDWPWPDKKLVKVKKVSHA